MELLASISEETAIQPVCFSSWSAFKFAVIEQPQPLAALEGSGYGLDWMNCDGLIVLLLCVA